MENRNIQSALRRYFTETLPAELQRITALFLATDDSAKEETEAALQDLWVQTDGRDVTAKEVQDALAIVNHRIDSMDKQGLRRRPTHMLLRWAAMLAIPILMAVGGWLAASRYEANAWAMQQCYVPDGTIRSLMLSDGTRVVLGGGSSIIYPKTFSHWIDRQVYISGEVHFDVQHDVRRPFRVNVGNLSVKVLGTHFNVRAYPEDSLVTTSLEQGRVEVGDGHSALILLPNEQAVYDRGAHTLMRQPVNAQAAMSWVTGRLYFDDQPLQTVLTQLRHRYDVRFRVDPMVNQERRFTMRFNSNENLDNILHVITGIASDISCQRQGNVIHISARGRKNQEL
ncbi:FecR family protein [Prevotella sp. KH2C16]|uniref:FecR family protein n=1 Tax=Prevotella sp. KH2C16 TaxID=1855325 RepID=UPI0008EAE460|nr:FecR family protein [Prevotella sp. KH2C16]SFG71470.1 ferric-dicitrate binding protein FerR, regulates iron transport through sigma-19 [Prevotella sp. KH2C16]